MKIAISGELGSGKTILSEKLSSTFGIDIISIGKIQRNIASEKGMSTLEFNKHIETRPEFDEDLDEMIKNYGKTEDSLILDSRLAWHFAPNSFKVHLLVNIDIATKRVFNDSKRKNESEKYKDIETAKIELIERKKSERKRFINQYNVDINDFNNYDLVIDTSYVSPETIFQTFLSIFNKWKKDVLFNRIFFCPKTLIPTQGIREHSIKYTNDIKESIKSQGFSEDYPVMLMKYENNYFIFDGHKRVSSAINLNLELIPCIIIEENTFLNKFNLSIKSYLLDNYNLRNVYDWEALHQFNFSNYINKI